MCLCVWQHWPVDCAVFLTLRCWLGVSVELGHFKHKHEFFMSGMGVFAEHYFMSKSFAECHRSFMRAFPEL